MTDERLLELIETWGADPAAFPEAERVAATARLHEAPERFADAVAAARALDAALADLPDILPSPALAASLIASAPKQRAAKSVFGLPRFSPWAPAGGAAALAAGLFMGLFIAPVANATSETDEVEALLEQALGYDPAALTEEAGE
jgi:hypothetical protein